MCYGILYGMGTHSLAQQLDVTVEEAAALLEGFKRTYKGYHEFATNFANAPTMLG